MHELIDHWRQDLSFRLRTGLEASLGLCCAYCGLQLGLGIYYGSFWYYTLAAYYGLLLGMRMLLWLYLRRQAPGSSPRLERRLYLTCGWMLLIMNLALVLMLFFMLYWGRSFRHHPITAIAMAAYTFTALTLAITNLIRYRKLGSPAVSAAKAISLAAACVSMITLTSTLLTTFGSEESPAFHRLMVGSVGGAVSIFIILLALFMIRKGKTFQITERPV